MRKFFIVFFLFFLLPGVNFAQYYNSFPAAVCVRITPQGNAELRTAANSLNLYLLYEANKRSDFSDSVRLTTNAFYYKGWGHTQPDSSKRISFAGYSNFNATTDTYQYDVNTTPYVPEIKTSAPNGMQLAVSPEEWQQHFDKWDYQYFKDGRLERIVVYESLTIPCSYTYQTGISTIDFIYNTDKKLIAQCHYEGKPIVAIRDSIAVWEKRAKQSQQDGNADGFHIANVISLFVYDYTDHMLRSTVFFTASYTAIYSDTFEYNAQRKLVNRITYDGRGEYRGITLAYDSSGKIISKQEAYWCKGEVNCAGMKTEDKYSYGKDGRITVITRDYPDPSFPEHIVTEIDYGKNH